MKRYPFVDIIAGARPNFMKAGPIYQELSKSSKISVRFVFSGQHTSSYMTNDIYNWVGLPYYPDIILGANKTPGFDYLGYMMSSYDLEIKNGAYRPIASIILGDTDTSLAAAIVASRNAIPIIHVEAGVRSGDRTAPEELNRIMIDSISDVLLTPFVEASELLLRTCNGYIVTVGNVMIDALRMAISNEKFKNIKAPDNVELLVTLHRQSNVDDLESLSKIIEALDSMNQWVNILFPAHPRTRAKLEKLEIKRDYIVDPLVYPVFLKTLSNAKAVLTDSGGVQVEAASLNVPCFVLRESTGWTNLLCNGLVKLTNLNNIYDLVLDACTIANKVDPINIHLWDGNTAKRISSVILEYIEEKCPIKGEYYE